MYCLLLNLSSFVHFKNDLQRGSLICFFFDETFTADPGFEKFRCYSEEISFYFFFILGHVTVSIIIIPKNFNFSFCLNILMLSRHGYYIPSVVSLYLLFKNSFAWRIFQWKIPFQYPVLILISFISGFLFLFSSLANILISSINIHHFILTWVFPKYITVIILIRKRYDKNESLRKMSL